MARTAGSKKDETHDRIVDVAARALRRDGLAGTGVSAVMQEAGLTHGGFYAHFGSRDALLVEAMAQAGKESGALVRQAIADRAPGISRFRALVETYLADAHLGHLEIGCPVAALCSDMPRQSAAVKKASSRGVQLLVDTVQQTLPATPDPVARTIAGTLVGALQMARTLGNNRAGKTHLAAVRSTLLQLHDRGPQRQ